MSGDIDPNFYTGSDFTGSRNCGDFITGGSGACIARANADGQLFIEVNNLQASAVSYDVSVALAADTGTPSSPLTVASGYSGNATTGISTSTVDIGNFSYLKVTGLTPDNLYTFSLTGLSGNTSFALYQGIDPTHY